MKGPMGSGFENSTLTAPDRPPTHSPVVLKHQRRVDTFMFLALMFAVSFSWGQQTQKVNDTLSFVGSDTLRLGVAFLVPFSETIFVDGVPVAQDAYQIDYKNGTLVWLASPRPTKFVFQARKFTDFLPNSLAFRRFERRMDSTGKPGLITEEYPDEKSELQIVPSTMQRSGSISRGISVGNNQNLSVSSGLRLQLEGDLGDDLKLQAAITDESIPIQPDGTTQQINDFDKVFIQLLRRDDRVVLGDFEINHGGTQFANFYRNVQGIGFQINQKGFSAGVNGAVAKGKFNTVSIQGKEGMQGPYRLTGKNNERFIIVLAGSEKVYLNGEIMTRGEGNDYVMDYNTGELTFTSQRVINSVSRIVVDFEYTDRNYNRSLFFTEFQSTLLKDKLTIKGSYGRDADNANAPVEGPFSPEEVTALREAGDSAFAVVSGIDSVGPADNETIIHYARRDSLVAGVLYERYFFSTVAGIAVYRITFSEVGQGNGMYVKDQNLVNGTVYKWVGPDSVTGLPKGNYAPLRVLVPAKIKQVVDLALTYKIKPNLSLYTETAVSSEDLNRQSALDEADNFDLANKTGIRIDKIKLSDSLQLRFDVSHRFVGARYSGIDRVYKVEYGREWNFDDKADRLNEQVSEAIVEIRHGKTLRFNMNGATRFYGDQLFSTKQTYEAESQHKWVQGKYTFTSVGTENKSTGSFSRWNRHNGNISKRMGNWTPGVEIWLEDKTNEIQSQQQAGAFRFQDLKPYLKTKEGGPFQLQLAYNYRQEFEFADSAYREKSIAHIEYAKLIWSPISTLSLQNTTTLRQFQVQDSSFRKSGLEDSQTLVTNLQGNWNTKNQLVFANVLYEITAEQLARKQVAYVQVNPGQGDYEWIDADSNGIQGLDEFQFSVNPNRSNFFVRIFVPSTELFPTTSLNFTGNFKLDFRKAIARSDNPLKETLRNISAITNFRVSQKQEAGQSLQNYFIRLGSLLEDSTLLDAQYNIRQDLYFFRNSPKGDFKFTFGDNKSKLFLVSGDELRGHTYYGSDQRLNFGRDKSIENEFRIGNRLSQAVAFDSRNFNINYWELKPKVNYQVSQRLRLSLGYEYKHKENTNDSSVVDARVNIHKAVFDSKFNLKERNNLFAKLEMVYVGQEGNGNFSTEYELRDGLQKGINGIWQVFATIYLNKSLELGLTYDGRAAENTKVLHTGRVQLKAYF